MKRNALMITLAGVAIAVAALTHVPAGTPAPAQLASPTAPAVATTQAAPLVAPPVSAAGYVVHLDGNGKLTTEPQTTSDAEFNAQVEKMVNTSSAGLQQVTMPNGAVMVRLDGRFMSTMTATKDAGGSIVAPCLTDENDVKALEKTAAAQAAKKE
jgi:hypothetical protein